MKLRKSSSECPLSKRAAVVTIAALIVACAAKEGSPSPPSHTPPATPACAECKQSKCSGWIDIEFDILPSGSVANPVVVAGCPPGVWDDAALKAVRGWKSTPSERSPPQARVRLKFEPE